MEENYVEAIEEGKIVRVSEKYARQEELPILKRAKINQVETGQQLTKLGIARKREEYLRKLKEPSNWRKSQVASELIDNFQWIITKERKKRGLTKKTICKSNK